MAYPANPRRPVKTVTTHYTATGDDWLIRADGTPGPPHVVTLPDATDWPGLTLRIKRVSTVQVRVDAQAGQTIDGQASFILGSQWDAEDVTSDGTTWSRA